MTRDEAAARIRRSELGVHADSIVDKLLPSLQIIATPASLADLPIGASRFGGVPDVPVGFEWPRWVGSRREFVARFGFTGRRVKYPETKLEFIAQLNLAELNDFAACKNLPREGMLYFFYDSEHQPWGFDPEDHLGSRVIFLEDTREPLVRCGDPTGTLSCAVSFMEEWTIPDWETLGLGIEGGPDILDELKQEIGVKQPEHSASIHRLLGWPEPIQGDMRLECECVSKDVYCGDGYDDPNIETLKQRAENWLLLLQVDSDTDNNGWMWGDTGRIYFWIHKNDLAERRFENVRMVLQCY